MKKRATITLFTILLLIALIPLYVNAKALGVQLTANANTTTIKDNSQNVEITLHLGEFNGISENSVLGYEATLEYDKSVIDSVQATGADGWTITFDPTKSSKIVGDTATAKANTDITKITFKLKSGLPAGSTDIKLKDLVLTDGTDQSTFSKTFTISYNGGKVDVTNETTNTNTQAENTTNTFVDVEKENKINSTATPGNNTAKANLSSKTNSTSTNASKSAISKLPAAGLDKIIIVAIIIVAIFAIIFKFKSRKIK